MSDVQGPSSEGYFESWRLYGKTPEEAKAAIDQILNRLKTNTVDISFGSVTGSTETGFTVGGLEFSGDPDIQKKVMQYLIQRAHERGMDVKISLGGASYGFSGILTSNEAADKIAKAVADFVNANGLDGVDFDIEDYPSAKYQVELLKKTREYLGPDKTITYTPKGTIPEPYLSTIRDGAKYIDKINIMAYDAWSGYSYKDDVNLLLGLGVSPKQIVIGVMPGKDDIGGVTDIAKIKEIAAYVKAQKLGGMMYWDINRDKDNISGEGEYAASDAIWDAFHSGMMLNVSQKKLH